MIHGMLALVLLVVAIVLAVREAVTAPAASHRLLAIGLLVIVVWLLAGRLALPGLP